MVSRFRFLPGCKSFPEEGVKRKSKKVETRRILGLQFLFLYHFCRESRLIHHLACVLDVSRGARPSDCDGACVRTRHCPQFNYVGCRCHVFTRCRSYRQQANLVLDNDAVLSHCLSPTVITSIAQESRLRTYKSYKLGSQHQVCQDIENHHQTWRH